MRWHWNYWHPKKPNPHHLFKDISMKRAVLFAAFAAVTQIAFAQNAAVVNGKPIPSTRVDAMVKQMTAQGQKDTPELRNMIREELINREIFTQEAEKRGLADSAEFKSQIEFARQQILIRALVQDYAKGVKPNEADVKAEYEKQKSAMGDKEYRARHILVEKEDEAKKIVTDLKAGKKFEELAKKSKDPGSAAKGGDLDWASPGNYVPEFSAAMVKLQKGQYTQEPVKSQFGYHVIRLDDVRAAQVPPLEQVKPQIEEALTQQKLAAFQKDLKDKAKIQ
jgi:peptidyl-prolyl cis-trans isomerase C